MPAPPVHTYIHIESTSTQSLLLPLGRGWVAMPRSSTMMLTNITAAAAANSHDNRAYTSTQIHTSLSGLGSTLLLAFSARK
jgi:hypothetical protein